MTAQSPTKRVTPKPKDNSKATASGAGVPELTSNDVKNVLQLINGADIKVEQAELVVQLKMKLATYHNALLAAEKAAEKQ